MTTYFNKFRAVKIIKKSPTHFEVWKECFFLVAPLVSDLGLCGGGSGYDWHLDKVFRTLKKAEQHKNYLLNLLKVGVEIDNK